MDISFAKIIYNFTVLVLVTFDILELKEIYIDIPEKNKRTKVVNTFNILYSLVRS
jgi:hypothetical protein